eukprot:TRINITY_DN5090_c2_g1_i3.p1 TRINITY_DN5090_c2_g1~~TRINITY_DN5090_c2_g1_i3.p1  ORF type:complete len:588 (+),score=66.33 TRINITY_DN5090_c2_g1_i3:221-1984(+)
MTLHIVALLCFLIVCTDGQQLSTILQVNFTDQPCVDILSFEAINQFVNIWNDVVECEDCTQVQNLFCPGTVSPSINIEIQPDATIQVDTFQRIINTAAVAPQCILGENDAYSDAKIIVVQLSTQLVQPDTTDDNTTLVEGCQLQTSFAIDLSDMLLDFSFTQAGQEDTAPSVAFPLPSQTQDVPSAEETLTDDELSQHQLLEIPQQETIQVFNLQQFELDLRERSSQGLLHDNIWEDFPTPEEVPQQEYSKISDLEQNLSDLEEIPSVYQGLSMQIDDDSFMLPPKVEFPSSQPKEITQELPELEGIDSLLIQGLQIIIPDQEIQELEVFDDELSSDENLLVSEPLQELEIVFSSEPLARTPTSEEEDYKLLLGDDLQDREDQQFEEPQQELDIVPSQEFQALEQFSEYQDFQPIIENELLGNEALDKDFQLLATVPVLEDSDNELLLEEQQQNGEGIKSTLSSQEFVITPSQEQHALMPSIEDNSFESVVSEPVSVADNIQFGAPLQEIDSISSLQLQVIIPESDGSDDEQQRIQDESLADAGFQNNTTDSDIEQPQGLGVWPLRIKPLVTANSVQQLFGILLGGS